MKKNKNSDSGLSGIVLLAKQAGLTSFSSLSSVKRALSTTKVGHTGTLDSFADGLLVVLVGKLTHLVPHITNFDKTYIAVVEFGSETDTLDPTGTVIKTGKLPSKEDVEAVLPKFLGEIDQVPPAYSALHIDGKRASDLIREGKTVELKPRKITISSIKLLEFNDKYARIEVSCSKGTYIRSLARDIAAACGTVAHLKELRRTRVGPFKLEDACGADALFDPACSIGEESLHAQIRSRLMGMNMDVARLCGMDTAILAPRYINDFNNGRPLKAKMFVHDLLSENTSDEIAVFYDDGKFGGVITKKTNGNKFLLNYGFVVHHEESQMKIFSWEQVVSGKFPEEFKKSGTAITIGSFDGSHLGHKAIFDSVISQKEKNLVPGVITFTRSLRGYKNPETYEGDVVSLSQKLENLTVQGFLFAIVIDFSSEFGKITGYDFLSMLVQKCGLKYLAEGSDFHCGYKGLVGMEEIKKIASDFNFTAQTINSVIFDGEKVSSSRIRKCVLERDFIQVQKMLLKPFELDCTGFNWHRQGETCIFASKKGAQLLPPDGTYAVKVRFVDFSQKSGEAQNCRAANSDCTLENGILRLAFSDNLISGFVWSIQFL